MAKPLGYILWRGERHGIPVAVVATGYRAPSKNSKCSTPEKPMLQTWIIRTDIDPLTAMNEGSDDIVCFDCFHRGAHDPFGLLPDKLNTCYVVVARAPLQVYKAMKRGSYVDLSELHPIAQHLAIADAGSNWRIRIGSYGEPVIVPYSIWASFTSSAIGWTGYTHQWRYNPRYADFLMASTDSPEDYDEAKATGWRSFRVTPKDSWEPSSTELLCPASEEAGKLTTCGNCLICCGNKMASIKDVVIPAHGMRARHIQPKEAVTA